MSLGLVLLCVEALAVYGLVFAVHAARDRFTLAPYFALLGMLAAILRWATDAGILYQAGPITLLLGSVVFFTAILFGIFLLYIFDGVQAAQIGIYTVVAVSIVSPALALLFRFQLQEINPELAQRVVVSSLRVYVASTAAMILDFMTIAVLWELCTRHLTRAPLFFRISACLLTTYWLDAIIFNVSAFWGEAEFVGILEGNLVSRAVLTFAVCPLLTSYVAWEERRQHHHFTPRNLMAILHRSARRELDLFVAYREIEERKRIEEELRRRDSILKSLAFAAEHVLNRSGDAVRMEEILESLATASDISRARICENTRSPEGALEVAQRHSWPQQGHDDATWSGVPYRQGGLVRWEQSLACGEAIAGDVKTFPTVEQHALLSRGITSILVLPVNVADAWWGFLSLEQCGGSRAWTASEIDALRTAAGTLGASIQRAQIERELRNSEERLELALQGGDLGLWDWDIARDHIVFNERSAAMLGFALHDIEPTSTAWEALMHPDDVPAFRAGARAQLRGDTPSFELELRMRAKNGGWRWILSKGKVVTRDEAGRALRATGTHLDITRLKETEEALRFSQEMFRLMYEESPMGLILCDIDGQFVQANSAFRNLVGYTEIELQERTYFDVSARDFEEGEQDQLLSMQRTGRYGPFELAYVRKDGRRVPVISNGCLVTGADGKQYIWSIVEDISDRKAAEEAIAGARRYQREIETRIEETLLRGGPPQGLKGVDIAALNAPTEHMDGDFTDFVRLNATSFDVLVGDVMGKGILAALVSAGAKGHFLHALASQLAARQTSGEFPHPAALVREVHHGITRQLIDLDCFLTLCYARFDLEAGTVTFVDCGHTKTIRFRVPDHAYTLLEGENVPIGFLEEESYTEVTTDLQPGDVFFFYSDGLTESTDASGSMFGVDRLIDAIRLHASLDATSLTRRVLEIVREFSGPGATRDDQTCVAVKILEPVPASAAESFTIPASVEHLADARAALLAHLDRHQELLGGAGEFNRIVLAFVEAVSNVIRHSFPEDSGQDIQIEFRSSRCRLQIEIAHRGTPFRPRSTPLPDPNRKNEGGYGLYIMNRSFDHIGYETTSTGLQSLFLVKHFRGAEGLPPDTGRLENR